MTVALALLVLAAAFGFGLAVGVRVRGLVPLRAPSNNVRVGNAKADVELASATLARRRIEREIAQEEMELEGDQVKGAAALAELRAASEGQRLALERSTAKPESIVADVLTTRRAELLFTFTRLEAILRDCGSGITRKRLAEIEAGDGATDRELRLLARELDLDYQPPRLSRPDRVARLPHVDREHRASERPLADLKRGRLSENA